MDLQVESFRNRDELAADLAELSVVDWRRVWPGYSEADPATWCAQRGWKLAKLDRVENMWARLGSGGLLYLSQDRQPTTLPISLTSAEQDCWKADAQIPEDNVALFPAAEAAWSDYLAAASGTIGRPAVVTSFDDPAFPDLPDWSPRIRASRRRPYRLALWSFDGALALLDVSPSADAITTDYSGSIQISLLLRPVEVAEPARDA